MKKTTIALSLIMALLLTGCSGGNSSVDTDTSVSESSQTEGTTGTSAESPAESSSMAEPEGSAEAPGTIDTEESQPTESQESAGFALYGPGEDKIEPSEITRVDASDEADYMANGLSDSNWIQASISGFTYLAEPGGEYRRVSVGDDICGLTVFDAGCVFSADNEKSEGAFGSESWFSSGYAEFEGTVTASGTLSVLSEDDGIIEAGSVVFTPDSGTQLPVMNYQFSGDTGVTYPADAMYPPIVLTGVTVDSEGAHATLSMNGITVSSMVNGSSVMRAAASDVVFD